MHANRWVSDRAVQDYRTVPLWEGHTRFGPETLVNAINAAQGDRAALAAATVKFMDDIGKGFSPSRFGDAFQQEVREGCTKSRKGKPAVQNDRQPSFPPFFKAAA